MTTASEPKNAINILIVDDSPVFNIMVLRDLMRAGFAQTGETELSRPNAIIHMIDNFADAMSMIGRNSQRHMDFNAVFLDWHLSVGDRSAGHDGVQLGLAALEAENQPLNPVIYCHSADAATMVPAILDKLGDRAASEAPRVLKVDFMAIVSKILEVSTPAVPSAS
jgi:hypothetical protein